MTFPDVLEETEQKTELDTTNVKTAEFLQKLLLKAMSEGRLTSGMFECANVFRTDPEKVRLCILPVSASTDVSVRIQHKLIEAYCWENEIQLLKVDSVEKLSAILNSGEKKMHQKSTNAMPVTTASVDCSCVLVTFSPKDARHKDDESYAFMEHILSHQVIELPPD
ncbi:hypothetical protein CHS0354_001169 [Potamilus streckersoni]|uniref:Ribosomal protein eL8/eL30/eS12/Gadd45 domain-containing protein n=1 Tax=Potamilus streckersoni TaxID=2493646 RepID=A0AAE0T606_9BIVA|nr:hypothetical protein CHS0354_001169 [Potamilus streckersoni]